MKNTRNLILIVEDDEKLRQTLEDFLTANHFAVLTAVDGEQALTLYYANNHLIDDPEGLLGEKVNRLYMFSHEPINRYCKRGDFFQEGKMEERKRKYAAALHSVVQ